MANRGKGKPFVKGDPRIVRGNGRPAKTDLERKAEKAMRDAIPHLILMKKSQLELMMAGDPTGAEIVAYHYMIKHSEQVVDRLLGKIPAPQQLSGPDGGPIEFESRTKAPLAADKWSDEQINRFLGVLEKKND